MAGSLRYYNYVSDNGNTYAVLRDKSNTAAVNGSGATAPGTLPSVTLPRNIVARYALFSDVTGTIKRRVTILTPADLLALTPTTSFVPQGETATVTITSSRGEKLNLPKLPDTARTT